MIVAEECAGAREGNSKFIGIDLRAEISGGERWRGGFAVDRENIPSAVHHGDDHGVGIGSLGRGLDKCADGGGGQTSTWAAASRMSDYPQRRHSLLGKRSSQKQLRKMFRGKFFYVSLCCGVGP